VSSSLLVKIGKLFPQASPFRNQAIRNEKRLAFYRRKSGAFINIFQQIPIVSSPFLVWVKVSFDSGRAVSYGGVVPGKIRVSLVGVSGFSGAELARLLTKHPAFTLVSVVGESWKGSQLGQKVEVSGSAASLTILGQEAGVHAASQADIALLATPAEVSLAMVPELLAQGTRVVDLSGAFRLSDPQAYPDWYGFEHSAPELLKEACYSIPELPAVCSPNSPPITHARLVSNPGCYATAAIVGLAPLVQSGWLTDGCLFADGKSGATGAGRKLAPHLLFNEVSENLSAYRIGRHQHTPEIEQSLSRIANRSISLQFTPHLLPIRRGLMVTSYAAFNRHVTGEQLQELYQTSYGDCPQVRLLPPNETSIASVVHTPRVHVGSHSDPQRKVAMIVSVLDNLLKGAATQALQNLCAMTNQSFEQTWNTL
jgi:N-acetyl-gamma-glutamyl-phosphate reductase